jgi:hypothetical protein
MPVTKLSVRLDFNHRHFFNLKKTFFTFLTSGRWDEKAYMYVGK